MQARWGTHGDHPAIVLMPASVRETFDLTVEAINLAEELRTPVILLLDEIVGHMRERIELPPVDEIRVVDRVKPTEAPADFRPYKPGPNLVPPMPAYGDGYRFHVSGLVHDETGFPSGKGSDGDASIRRLLAKVEQRKPKIGRAELFQTEDADVVVIAAGSVARSAKAAVKEARARGIRLGLLRPITAWPFPADAIDEVSKTAKAVIVAEMNLGQMLIEVERLMAGRVKAFPLNRIDAELITPEEILARTQEVIGSVN